MLKSQYWVSARKGLEILYTTLSHGLEILYTTVSQERLEILYTTLSQERLEILYTSLGQVHDTCKHLTIESVIVLKHIFILVSLDLNKSKIEK